MKGDFIMKDSYNATDNFSIQTVRNTFARVSCVTLSISFLALTFFELIQSIFAVYQSQRYVFLESLYYMLGDSSIGIINLAFGIIVFIILGFLTTGLFISHNGAANDNDSTLLTGLNISLYSLTASIITEIVVIIISLASVSIINYNYYASLKTDTYTSDDDAVQLFFLTIILGAALLTLTIALVRLTLSFRRNTLGNSFSQKGSMLTMISSIFAAVASGCTFCASLFSLIVPSYDYKELQAPDPSKLLMNMIDILMAAALTVAFITIAVLISHFMTSVEKHNLQAARPYRINQYPPAPPQAPVPLQNPGIVNHHFPAPNPSNNHMNAYPQPPIPNPMPPVPVPSGPVPPIQDQPIPPMPPMPPMPDHPMPSEPEPVPFPTDNTSVQAPKTTYPVNEQPTSEAAEPDVNNGESGQTTILSKEPIVPKTTD